jgi:hypothetical protein
MNIGTSLVRKLTDRSKKSNLTEGVAATSRVPKSLCSRYRGENYDIKNIKNIQKVAIEHRRRTVHPHQGVTKKSSILADQ